MKIVDLARIDRGERGGEEIGLFLIVAFEADAVERPYDSLKQSDRMVARNDLAARQRGARGETLAPRRPTGVPLPHAPAPQKVRPRRRATADAGFDDERPYTPSGAKSRGASPRAAIRRGLTPAACTPRAGRGVNRG